MDDVLSQESFSSSTPLIGTACEWNGIPALNFQTESFSLIALPERGGKIASLKDGSGNEWLSQPQLPLKNFEAAISSFVDGDMCGWDECGPTVAACEVGGALLPDHGELWSQSWVEEPDGWLAVRGKVWDYKLSRRFGVRDEKLVVEYELESEREQHPYLWAAHPQFQVDEYTAILFDGNVQELVDVMSPDLRMVAADSVASVGSLLPGTCGKFYVDPSNAVRQIGLRRRDGSKIEVSWSELVPYVGVWIDRSVYARHDVVSLSPSTGYFDNCDVANRSGKVPVIGPASKSKWELTISLTPNDEVRHR